MARSARVQQLLQELTPAERAELFEELARDRELAAGQAFLDQALSEVGPIPDDEIARIRREWPRATLDSFLSPAWEQIVEQRSREVDEGVAESIPGNQAFAEIEAELRARRGSR